MSAVSTRPAVSRYGTPLIRASSLLRRDRARPSTSSHSSKVPTATAAITTPTSVAGSGWLFIRRCPACWRMRCRMVSPIAAEINGGAAPTYPWPVLVFLQVLVLLPAFGLVYAVGVAHVLGPRIVIRRSLQYALANRTLTVLALLPAGAPRALAVARPGADDPPGRDRQLRRLPAAHRRIGGSVPLSRAGAAVARSALLSRRVRRAQDSALAG